MPIYNFQINPNQSGAKLDDPDLHLEFVYAINDALKDLVLYLIKAFRSIVQSSNCKLFNYYSQVEYIKQF